MEVEDLDLFQKRPTKLICRDFMDEDAPAFAGNFFLTLPFTLLFAFGKRTAAADATGLR